MAAEFIPYHSIEQLTAIGLTVQDFYQHADYVALDAGLQGGEPFIFILKETTFTMAIPVIRRRIIYRHGETDYYDVTSPYGYPGYIMNREPDDATRELLLDELKKCAQQNNVVSVFLRLHPFFNAFTLPDTNNRQLVQHGATVFVDLHTSADILRSRYSTNHKRGIRLLLRDGFTTKINSLGELPAFIDAYTSTMELVEAKKYYRFDIAYFDRLMNIFHENIFLISAHHPDGTFASGAIFIATGDLVQYHLGGTAAAMRTYAASKLVFDAAIVYFHDAGKNILHLGGGYGSVEDELFRFKSGFSKSQKRFCTLRMITDEKIYTALTLDHTGGSITSREFFPAYRNI